jgi:hypothetical protein
LHRAARSVLFALLAVFALPATASARRRPPGSLSGHLNYRATLRNGAQHARWSLRLTDTTLRYAGRSETGVLYNAVEGRWSASGRSVFASDTTTWEAEGDFDEEEPDGTLTVEYRPAEKRYYLHGRFAVTYQTSHGEIDDFTTVDLDWRTRVQGGKLQFVGTFHHKTVTDIGQVIVEDSKGSFSGKLR